MNGSRTTPRLRPVIARLSPVRWTCIILFLFGAPALACASDGGPFVQFPSLDIATLPEVDGDSLAHGENERLVASGLALFLGPFGAHRLYFGTTAKVAIIYGITLGGFGILAVIDLGHILFTRDLTRYHGSDRVFMWAKPKAPLTPP